MADTQAIVTIHGLWMHGLYLAPLNRRLARRCACAAESFSYHSMTGRLADSMQRLSAFIAGVDADVVHLVGHSLGGVLALQMLRAHPTTRVGRVVCLGSPLVDSAAARGLSRWPFGQAAIGRTLREAVLDAPLTGVEPPRQVGVVAGTLPLGIGRLVAHLDPPHDGVVAVSETRLPGITSHLLYPASHFALVVSRGVADATARFLDDGHF